MEPANCLLERDRTGRPGLTLRLSATDNLQPHPVGISETQNRLAEAIAHRLLFDALFLQSLGPKTDRAAGTANAVAVTCGASDFAHDTAPPRQKT